MHSADAIVTECNLYQTIISKRNPAQKFYTLYLAKAQSEKGNVVAAGETVRGKVILPPTDRWALCYLGSINHIIDISCISEILYSLPKRDKMPIVHVIGDGEQRERLLEAIRATGASAVFHGKVFEQRQKQQILDGCHFGLNVMKDSVFVGLTMKSLDYFAAGLPVLNTIKGDTWALVESEDIGINYQRNSQTQSGYIQADRFDTEYMRYRENVRKMFQRYFTVQAFEKKVSEIMSDVCKQDAY